MLSKNDCMGWQMPVSCFDCHCKILSDPVLAVMESVDWTMFLFLERYKGCGRHPVHSRIGLLKALLYMELSGIPSVHELLRILGRDPYKMKILGLESLPHDSVFTRYKRELGEHMDKIISMLVGMLKNLDPELYQELGIDSTKLEAYTYKDKQAGWGYDHIAKRYYKGYKIHLLYNTRHAVPLAYTVTSAKVHDNKQFKPLIKKLGAGILETIGLYADSAYDSEDNVETLASIRTTMINRRNKRNSKNKYPKYRIQYYCQVHGNKLNHLYKKRIECEVTNGLLKEHLYLERTRTKGRIRTRVKTGLTIAGRQIQVLHQLIQKKNTRTTIMN
jgi:IS5 family transposase